MADKDVLEKVCQALQLQFENVPQAARDEGEKYLNDFAAHDQFVPNCIAILSHPPVPFEVRKAAGIFLEKKLTSTCNIREMHIDEMTLAGNCLIKALCDEGIPLELKPYIQYCLQALTYSQVSGKPI